MLNHLTKWKIQNIGFTNTGNEIFYKIEISGRLEVSHQQLINNQESNVDKNEITFHVS